ncbi:MAG: prolyl oligopeptidase family serine peptidase, partial [Nitriliruptorales bacterium]
PEGVPDRGPALSEPLARGELARTPLPDLAGALKTVDGDIGDWARHPSGEGAGAGVPSGIGGTSMRFAGEHIYSDFLFDAYGADDGDDAERMSFWTPLAEAESRTHRLAMLQQAAGDQFDAERPVGASDHYGDAGSGTAADLLELRWSVQDGDLHLLVRFTNLTAEDRVALLILADVRPEEGEREVGLDTGLATVRHDLAVLLTADGIEAADTSDGSSVAVDGEVAVNPAGWTNALEARLPADLLAPDGTLRVAVASAVITVDEETGERAVTPVNVAYRDDEPIDIYNDRRQALALHGGDIDGFTTEIDLAALEAGTSEAVRPGPGYHERTFVSGENMSVEDGEQGIHQRYGLFVPSSYDPASLTPVTYWLHYRGGKAHSGAAWTPRLITQLGEERGNLVITPHARGTSTWYVSKAHQDVFEVLADADTYLTIDPQRRYLSGYSMGGYGTYLFGLLYPDLFAAGFAQSGAVTQGLWTGEGPDECRLPCHVEANDGDANAQLTFRLLENARHFPIWIDHGSDDELVPITGVQRMALRLRELGYRYGMTTFLGYEHFSQALVDEWFDGAQWLDRFALPTAPRRVTYKVVPALVHALNTVRAGDVTFDFDPDGAWWVDGIEVRDGDPMDPSVSGVVEAESHALRGDEQTVVPFAGAASPPGHSTPYARHGQDWQPGAALPTSNTFSATLTNVAAVTLAAEGMGLDTATPIVGTVVTDGPATLRIDGLPPVRVLLDGEEVKGAFRAGAVEVTIPEGEHDLELVPRAPGRAR